MNRKIKVVFVTICVTVISIIILFPIIMLFSNSFKYAKDIFIFPPQIVPLHPTFSNFLKVLIEYHFLKYILNSLFVSVAVTIISVIVSSMAAYSFARLEFPGKNVLFAGTISTMMIPFPVIIIPLFLIVDRFGWVNTYYGLILPVAFTGFGTFFLRQFYIGIPRDLEEAAIIDGCSTLQVWYYVFLPLSRSMVIILSLLLFTFRWNEFLWALAITNSDKMRVIQLAIQCFQGQYGAEWGAIMAASTIAAIPTIAIFLLFQKYIVAGIKMTGLKT